MDTKDIKEGRNHRNTFATRSHSIFNSIINLSPLGISSIPPRANIPSSTERKPDNDEIIMAKKNHKKSSPMPKVGVTKGGGSPLGPAPRTFSILTALNELSIFDKVPSHPKPNNNSYQNDEIFSSDQISRTSGAIKQRRKCGIAVPHEGEFFSSSAFTNFAQSSDQVGRKKLGRVVLGRRHENLLAHGKVDFISENERIKSNTGKPPEWILEIFQLTKCGKTDELTALLEGLDSTVIRHLVDPTGKNLLHCAASGGHLHTLQLLVSTLGPLADAALNDNDDTGHTPILRALKKKRLDCFKWLVLQTNAGGLALFPERERSLLHYASSFGNLMAVRWISGVLNQRGISVDVKDMLSGMTPLCEGAQAGMLLVCHELILNGANPLYQTEFGWRPVDFAIRKNQMECANYLMMAETAASLGSALHFRLKEFQTLQQEHDFLRNHFRELLRVGKWLAKERTDLIKNFSSTGVKPPEAFLLLGETGSGTRFSDMEHKLGQAEQASKHLLLEKNTFPSNTTEAVISTNGDAFNLQETLEAAKLRCETMLDLDTGTVEDYGPDNGSMTASSSDDDDTTLLSGCFDTDKLHKQSCFTNTHKYKSRLQKCDKSDVAPWLLSSSPRHHDAVIVQSQLSPLLSQLDLLETPTQSRTCAPSQTHDPGRVLHQNSLGRDGYLSHSTVFYRDDQKESLSQSLQFQPTVLEVIEPNLVSIKGPPDLIRETTRGAGGGDSLEGLNENWCGRQGERGIDDTIYSEIRSSSTSSCLKRDCSLSEFVPTPFSQSPIISNPSTNKCQTHQSCCDTDVLSSMMGQPISPHPSSSSEATYLDPGSSRCNINPVSNVDVAGGKKSSRSNNSHPKLRFPSRPQSDQLLSDILRNEEGESSSTRIDSSLDTLAFPVQVSPQFPQQLHCNGSQEDVSYLYCGNLGQVLPESISTSNTPVMQRSFSSFSHSSSTVLFPCNRKGKLELPLMNLESTLDDGRLSPSPSETSRTESAFAPPPSNTSQGSGGSKTESAWEVTATSSEVVEERTITIQNETKSYDNQLLQRDGNQHQLSGRISLELASNPDPASVEDIEGSPVSSRIHKKASIHYVTKNGRRQRKAWYDIEGSDEEDESFLRKTVQSNSNKSHQLSLTDHSNSNDEHECDLSCPQQQQNCG